MPQTNLPDHLAIMDALASYYGEPATVSVKGTQCRISKKCNVKTAFTYFTDFDIYKWKEWRDGALIQDVWPDMSDDDREFIMTRITPAEWDNILPPEEE